MAVVASSFLRSSIMPANPTRAAVMLTAQAKPAATNAGARNGLKCPATKYAAEKRDVPTSETNHEREPAIRSSKSCFIATSYQGTASAVPQSRIHSTMRTARFALIRAALARAASGSYPQPWPQHLCQMNHRYFYISLSSLQYPPSRVWQDNRSIQVRLCQYSARATPSPAAFSG